MLFGLTEDDVIARCILYAQLFDGDIHTDQVLFPVGKSDQNGFYHWSGVLRRLAPQDADVHMIGCGIASDQNKLKGNPAPGPARRYYCGFRAADVRDIPLVGDDFLFELENDTKAHVDVRLKIEAQGKSARGTIRTEALMAIAEVFGEPIAHICPCDNGDAYHPIIAFGEQCLRGERRSLV